MYDKGVEEIKEIFSKYGFHIDNEIGEVFDFKPLDKDLSDFLKRFEEEMIK